MYGISHLTRLLCEHSGRGKRAKLISPPRSIATVRKAVSDSLAEASGRRKLIKKVWETVRVEQELKE
jgi:hypothetical protein